MDVLVTLFEEFGPVGEGTSQHASIYEVKLCRKGPLVFEVIDVKPDVGRDAGVGVSKIPCLRIVQRQGWDRDRQTRTTKAESGSNRHQLSVERV